MDILIFILFIIGVISLIIEYLGVWLIVFGVIFVVTLLIVAIWKLCTANKPQKQYDPYYQDISRIDSMDGFTFEHFVGDLLKRKGYKNVCVTKGSGDFGVDITAELDGRKWAFQCKNYASNLGVKPIQEVYSGSVKYGASVSVVVTNSFFTAHAQELAKSLGVILWNRNKLIALIAETNLNDKTPQNKVKKKAKDVNYVSPIPNPVSNKTFICAKCGKELAIKYLHKDNICASCYEKENNNQVQTNGNASENNSFDICIINDEVILTPSRTQNHDENIPSKENEMPTLDSTGTILSAGKYVFGEDIPLGKYNLKVISGKGALTIQRSKQKDDEDFIWMGIEKDEANSYYGLSLKQGFWFALGGNLTVEISKSKMIDVN